jgi:hypothetical protein
MPASGMSAARRKPPALLAAVMGSFVAGLDALPRAAAGGRLGKH